MNISDRLKQARAFFSLNQKEFASKSGVGFSTFQKYEMGLSLPGADAISGFMRLGMSANWLLTGEGAMLLSDVQPYPALPDIKPEYSRVSDLGAFMPPVPHPGFIFVPRFEVEASMGNGSVIHSEQIVDYLAFREDWVRLELGLNPKNLFLISSVGDSMEPTLRTNDLLLIDRGSAEVKHDAIYCFVYNGELRVKRIQFKMSGILIVKSDNQQYEAEIIPLDQRDSIKIIGRVVWFGRGM
jgi:phage repressor protein C with HTH and peptisase S24 domain